MIGLVPELLKDVTRKGLNDEASGAVRAAFFASTSLTMLHLGATLIIVQYSTYKISVEDNLMIIYI